MKRLIMALAMALFDILGAYAESEVVDGVTWSYETFSDGGKTCARIIPGAVGTVDDLTIPSFLGGYPVTSIGDSAFLGCGRMTSVTVPNGVTSIGVSAFRGCSKLASVTIPASVTSVGGNAFFSCSGLTKVYISDLSAWCRIVFGVSAQSTGEIQNANPLRVAHRLFLN